LCFAFLFHQDPVLFSGSLRSNLDPFRAHTDEECMTALSRVQVRNFDVFVGFSVVDTSVDESFCMD